MMEEALLTRARSLASEAHVVTRAALDLAVHLGPSVRFKVPMEGRDVWMEYEPSDSKALTVVFHAAAPEFVKFPWFSGRRLLRRLPSARLSIADPSVTETLRIGWYAGNKDQPHLTENLARFIDTFRHNTGARKLIAFGVSSGGFASLQLATRVNDITAVVVNPQTDIRKYYPGQFSKYVDQAWNGDSALLPTTAASVIENAHQSKPSNSSVVYLQNLQDTFHVKAHAAPIHAGKIDTATSVTFVEDNWGEGHVVPDKAIMSAVLKDVLDGKMGASRAQA